MRSLTALPAYFSNSAAAPVLGVLLSSSGEDQAVAGETFELSVTVQNISHQPIGVDVMLDGLPDLIYQWEQTAWWDRWVLAPGQSEDVVFRLLIPPTARAGHYEYRLVIHGFASDQTQTIQSLQYPQILKIKGKASEVETAWLGSVATTKVKKTIPEDIAKRTSRRTAHSTADKHTASLWYSWALACLFLGSCAGLLWLMWIFLSRLFTPAKILHFTLGSATDANRLNINNWVHVDFEIAHINQIKSLKIVGQAVSGEQLNSFLSLDFSGGYPAFLGPYCQQQQQRLICQNVPAKLSQTDHDLVSLSLVVNSGHGVSSWEAAALSAPIIPAGSPNILALETSAELYTAAPRITAENRLSTASKTASNTASNILSKPVAKNRRDPHVARVNWVIEHPEQLAALQLSGRDTTGQNVETPITFDFRQGVPAELAESCVMGVQLICYDVPTGLRQAGTYRIDLLAIPVAIPEGDRPQAPILATSEPVEILPQPLNVFDFTLNGQPARSLYAVPVTSSRSPLTLAVGWDVEDQPGTQVQVIASSDRAGIEPLAIAPLPAKGQLPLSLPAGSGSTVISLQVSNALGEQTIRSTRIFAYEAEPTVPEAVFYAGQASSHDGAHPADASSDRLKSLWFSRAVSHTVSSSVSGAVSQAVSGVVVSELSDPVSSTVSSTVANTISPDISSSVSSALSLLNQSALDQPASAVNGPIISQVGISSPQALLLTAG